MQYQNIWITDLEDGLTTFVITLDLPPTFQHPFTTPNDSTEPIFSFN